MLPGISWSPFQRMALINLAGHADLGDDLTLYLAKAGLANEMGQL